MGPYGYLSGNVEISYSSLVRVRTIENDNFDWTVIEYPANLVKMWRYVNISATAKTNTIALPNAMKDTEYAVEIAPIFNGHLLHSAWAGDLKCRWKEANLDTDFYRRH